MKLYNSQMSLVAEVPDDTPMDSCLQILRDSYPGSKASLVYYEEISELSPEIWEKIKCQTE